MTRWYAGPIALALVVLLMAPAAPAPAPAGTLRIGLEAQPTTMDPGLSTDLYSQQVYSHVLEGLLMLDPEGVPRPALATSWTPSADGRTWTFRLREGVRFHDGAEFTADDVKYTIERILNPETRSPQRGLLSQIASVEAADRHTVRIATRNAFAPILTNLAIAAYILPRAAHSRLGRDFARRPVGTGPYKMVEWVADDRIVLEANADYYGGRPALDRVQFRFIPEGSVRLAEVESGGLDLIAGVPAQDLRRLRVSLLLDLQEVVGTNCRLLGFNTSVKPYDDVRVRQAIAHALDKQRIVDVVWPGRGVVAEGPIPPTSWAYDGRFRGLGHNVARARQLLAEAGLAGGFEMNLLVSESEEIRREVALYIDQLKAVNITVRPTVVDFPTLLDRLLKANYDVLRVGWTTNPEPDSLLYSPFHTSAIGGFNFTKYRSPRVDELLDRGRTLSNQADRVRVYQEAQRVIVQDAPMVFIFHEKRTYAHRKAVTGFRPHVSGWIVLKTPYGIEVKVGPGR
ncbi:MAG: ABC transporter substrate-binding protein [Armatimonadota bacterium]|nr:ABC transporter substrate-binding protein [Armatimonadota bacterium]MDR7453545.1 ABC transporter substrate-binding protein [Armatimonadota bacterium]MDR7455683.1 ABC transporter substrate-binding protein [Armatimonadota bacterium]MDR7497472.1 ABC transporter substrate-binding protein [Armatimonadota bacterium]MDR7512541.1 ABC transporter substrate-binding protein [Armatimonadota bacterium]